ncbi:EamA family transporter [Rhodoferax koreense]|uniref:EamA family transporter n=1 Tax=Rhodoferax koreensis TaxID=1842727 RepID=A0A1P8JUX3_9BURK|nr:DMT family transporter [Rhodoferax koreense]APW37559.1 EamA family transporter [Rhodoferax koreense]
MNTPSIAADSKGPVKTGGRSGPLLGPVEWLLLLVAAIWGGSYSAAKVATEQMPVLQFLVLRFGLTFLVLLPALRGLAVASWPAALTGALILGINLLAIFVCETFGVSLTTASNAAFLISLCVAFTPLCEWWLLKTKPGGTVLAGAGLSLLGAGLLAFQHGGSASLAWGDGLMVLAAFLRGIMVCLTRRHGQRHGLPALTVTAVQMGVMALGSIILMLAVHGTAWPPLPSSTSFWSAMAFLVLLCTLFAFFAQNYAASRISPSRVALLMGSEPMWGALIAVLWMGEQMALQGWIGGLLIVASAWWVTRQGKKIVV